MTSSPSPVDTREEPVQAIPLQLQPLQGPPRPTETPEDTTPNGAIVTDLFRTVHRQTSLIEEQNQRLADLERAHSSVRPRQSPSQTPNRRGGSPRPSRSRSPRHSVRVRSPSYRRRSPRRRSPRRSPPRRSPARRYPPRPNRRSRSPSSSEDTWDSRHDSDAYDPFTRRVRDVPTPRELEKPPQMDSYEGTTDLDEHIENIEVVLTYRSVQGVVKCKLFVTTLRRGAVTWFKNLRRNSIDSWSDLYHDATKNGGLPQGHRPRK